MRAECFSSFCFASLHKDGAEIRRKKVYKSEMQMRKDCNGDDSASPLNCETGRSRGAVGRLASLFSLGNFFWTQDDAGESLHLPVRFKSFHCFGLFLTFADIAVERSSRHSMECVEYRTSQIDMQILS